MRVLQGALLIATIAVAVAAPSADAAATVPSSALAAVQAMTPTPSLVTGAQYLVQPTSAGSPAPTVAVSSDPVLGMPDHGSSYAVLSSGNAVGDMTYTGAQQDGEYTNAAGADAHAWRAGDINDLTVLRATIAVPSGANCIGFDLRFLSQEYPAYVGQFNDGLIVELDRNDWTSLQAGGFSAPGNFAYDSSGEPLSVNSTGSLGMTTGGAAGTGFASTAFSVGGGTGLLSAESPVTPGTHTLYFSIFDQGDNQLDTGALIDDLVASYVPGGCAAGAASPPAVPQAPVLTAQPQGASATGIFGFAPASGDTVLASYECSIDGGSWLGCSSGSDVDANLADGAHTFSVRGVSAAGQRGPIAGPVGWTIARPAPAAPAVSAAPPATTSDRTATIAFAGVPGATFTCSLDGQAYAPCSSPAVFTGLAVGAHTLRVLQTDPAGHASDAASIAWQVVAIRLPARRSASLLVQVRYRVPAACAAGCRARATLMLRTAGGAVRTLGTRSGVVLPRSRWARFTITVRRSTLLAAHATTRAGVRTSLTRLAMTSVRPDGSHVATVHDGHISVSVARIRSGMPPLLGVSA